MISISTISLFEQVGFLKDDRVIINLGSAKTPSYYAGKVTKINKKNKRVTVRTDYGKSYDKIVSNMPTGIIGFARNKRESEEAINPKHLLFWIDTNKWFANINL